MSEEKDTREFKFPETSHGKSGKIVDFNKAATDLGCNKVELTKNRMPDMIAWARKQK